MCIRDRIHVSVYLSGDFPPGFERLESATRETLEEFKNYADGKLTYQFIDPSVASTEEKRGQQYQQLVKAGLTPTTLFDNEQGKDVYKRQPQTRAQAKGVSFEEAVIKGTDEDFFDPEVLRKARALLPRPMTETQVYCQYQLGDVLLYGLSLIHI